MKIIFGILFAVLFGLSGRASPAGSSTGCSATQRFVSPDQVADFDMVARVGVTLIIALIGAVARRLGRRRGSAGRLFKREV